MTTSPLFLALWRFGGHLLLFSFVIAVACSSSALRYPACEKDEQCAVGGKHDYCVGSRCVYCRTATDCGDRQRCRAGACEADPNASPIPVADAGEDAEEEAGAEEREDAGEPDEDEDDRPSRVIPRGVMKLIRP